MKLVFGIKVLQVDVYAVPVVFLAVYLNSASGLVSLICFDGFSYFVFVCMSVCLCVSMKSNNSQIYPIKFIFEKPRHRVRVGVVSTKYCLNDER